MWCRFIFLKRISMFATDICASYDSLLMTEEDNGLFRDIHPIFDIRDRYNPHIQSDPLVIER